MCESVEGSSTTCTRQKAGSLANGGAAKPPPAGTFAGILKAPASTTAAEVMVVSASFRLARLSQGAASTGAASTALHPRMLRTRREIIIPRSLSFEGAYHVARRLTAAPDRAPPSPDPAAGRGA